MSLKSTQVPQTNLGENLFTAHRVADFGDQYFILLASSVTNFEDLQLKLAKLCGLM
jgi:hypothetical protein